MDEKTKTIEKSIKRLKLKIGDLYKEPNVTQNMIKDSSSDVLSELDEPLNSDLVTSPLIWTAQTLFPETFHTEID